MFEKRKLDHIRMDVLNAIAERSDGRMGGEHPAFFGLHENQIAGSLVTVGAFLLDGVISHPPVPEPDGKAEEKLIIQNLSVDGMVQASIFLAHALLRWCLVSYEYEHLMGRDTDAIRLQPREQRMLDLLERHFPVSAADAAELEAAAASYRDFDLRPETIKERDPVKSSGWMMYLHDSEYADPGEGETARSAWRCSSTLTSGSRTTITGPSPPATRSSWRSDRPTTRPSRASFPIEHDASFEAMQGELMLQGAWNAMGLDQYLAMLERFSTEAHADEPV